MTFGLLTISYRRNNVLHLFLASVKRLRNDCGYFPVVVVGDEEHKSLCEAYEVYHVTMPNHPATDKWNTGMDYLMSLGVNYICISGSDDIISTPLMLNLISAMERGSDIVGISDIYFFAGDGKYKGRLRHLVTHGQMLGVCRCVSRRIIEKVGGVLWNKQSSWGMDGIALRNMMPHLRTREFVQGVCVDIKTSESLNRWSFWLTRDIIEENSSVFYNILSEEEKQLILQI